MINRFIPKEFNFFALFEKQAGCAVEAAAYFRELVAKGSIDEISLEKMHEIEHKADSAAHDIIEQLNKTFITPFDREDIHALTTELDDIVDMFYTIVSRMKVYKINKINKDLVEFASVICDSVAGVACAVNGLSNAKNTKSVVLACAEVNRLENVGDAMRDKALMDLFENEKNPIEVIKWKEIYQNAETLLDICEDVVHVVGSILVKQA